MSSGHQLCTDRSETEKKMNTNNITIRLEKKEDYHEVENLVRENIQDCEEFDKEYGIEQK